MTFTRSHRTPKKQRLEVPVACEIDHRIQNASPRQCSHPFSLRRPPLSRATDSTDPFTQQLL